MSAGLFSAWAGRFGRIPWRNIASEALDRTLLVVKTACCVHVVNTYVCSVALVRGPSMIPAFNLTGDVILMDRVTVWRGKIGVGDVVFLVSPENPKKIVTKRVLGLEGDYVNFMADPALGTKHETVVVPKGHVWVQGDNIYDSRDSRQFGAVPYGLIQGRAFLRVWPPEDFGLIGQRGQNEHEQLH